MLSNQTMETSETRNIYLQLFKKISTAEEKTSTAKQKTSKKATVNQKLWQNKEKDGKLIKSNRRKHFRFKVPDEMYASLKIDDKFIQADIVDISSEGIAIKTNEIVSKSQIQLDLMYSKKSFSLTDINTTVVSKNNVKNNKGLLNKSNLQHKNTYSMRFVNMDSNQKSLLEYFLHKEAFLLYT